MGIFADTLENNTERNYDGFGCFGVLIPVKKFKEVNTEYRHYSTELNNLNNRKSPNRVAKKETRVVSEKLAESRRELLEMAKALHFTRARSLIRERLAMDIKKNSNIESHIVGEDIDLLIRVISDTIKTTIELTGELDQRIQSETVSYHIDVDESDEKANMVESIMYQAYKYITDEARCINRTDFRLIESDCARIIKFMFPNSSGDNRADVVIAYFTEHFAIRRSRIACPACRRYLFETIPNCLYCYERK